MLPCHFLLSSNEVGNNRIRSLSLASTQGSRPTLAVFPGWNKYHVVKETPEELVAKSDR